MYGATYIILIIIIYRKVLTLYMTTPTNQQYSWNDKTTNLNIKKYAKFEIIWWYQ